MALTKDEVAGDGQKVDSSFGLVPAARIDEELGFEDAQEEKEEGPIEKALALKQRESLWLRRRLQRLRREPRN